MNAYIDRFQVNIVNYGFLNVCVLVTQGMAIDKQLILNLTKLQKSTI